MASSVLVLKGVVDGGQRLMNRWYANDDLIGRSLGVQLHPGSINAFVTAGRPELRAGKFPFFPRDDMPDPSSVIGRRHFNVRDCTVSGYAAFMLRTEHPGKAYDGPGKVVQTRVPQPNTMFEIVAPLIPGIEYGVQVELVFDSDPAKIRAVPLR